MQITDLVIARTLRFEQERFEVLGKISGAAPTYAPDAPNATSAAAPTAALSSAPSAVLSTAPSAALLAALAAAREE
jgi:hypothetical protein